MRTPTVLVAGVLLLAGCGGGEDDPTVSAPSVSSTSVSPSADANASCERSDVEAAVCRLLLSVQTGDEAGLSPEEAAVATGIADLPGRSWVVEACVLEGDVTAVCEVRFPGEGTAAGFRVFPVNGEYDGEKFTVPPGEQLRYEVTEYLGAGPPGSFAPAG